MRAAALRTYRHLLQAAWVREVPVGPVDETLERVDSVLRAADVVELLKAGASGAAIGRYLRRTWPELLPRFRRLAAQARAERIPTPRGPTARRKRR